jgi:hypothetical protein
MLNNEQHFIVLLRLAQGLLRIEQFIELQVKLIANVAMPLLVLFGNGLVFTLARASRHCGFPQYGPRLGVD